MEKKKNIGNVPKLFSLIQELSAFEILSVVCKETVSGFREGESIRYGDYTQNADSTLLRLVHLGPSGDNTSRPRGYKTSFVLNSAEHEILNAHKYKSIK